MSRNLKIAIASLVLFIMVGAIWYTYPKKVDRTLQAIYFELDNKETSNEVEIRIKGKLKTSLLGNKEFKGTIDIEGEEMPVPEEFNELTIKFPNNDGWGTIVYTGIRENGLPFTYGYGSIFINHNMSQVTILKGSWTADNGDMFAGPAKNRKEAIQISNELMSKFLEGFDSLE